TARTSSATPFQTSSLRFSTRSLENSRSTSPGGSERRRGLATSKPASGGNSVRREPAPTLASRTCASRLRENAAHRWSRLDDKIRDLDTKLPRLKSQVRDACG